MTKLPEKPSELLNLALKCLRDCEHDIDYEIDMGCCHSPGHWPGWPTKVDIAGAVMAVELGAQPDDYCLPSEFPADHRKLDALVIITGGDVSIALELLGHPDFHSMDFEPICYAANPDLWHRRMNDLVKQMEGHGL